METSVFIAVSLDGFIARPDGSLDWLPGADGGDAGEDFGYQAFIETVDWIVMGRRTYEVVQTFGAWPYQRPVAVLSSRPQDGSASLPPGVEWMSGAPEDLLLRLSARGAKAVYVDGGLTIQRFLEARLINRLTIAWVPVLLGEGIPLFGPLSGDMEPRHCETKAYPSGLVQSTYESLR